MKIRQKTLTEVYDYVRKYQGIHTQVAFAEAVNYSRSVISSALNGNELYLTDSLFKSICAAFPGVFNLDYLLTGEGTLLVGHETVDEKSINVSYKDTEVDMLKKKIEILEDTIKRQKSMIDQYESFVDLLMRQNKNAENNLREGYVSEGGIQASVYDSKK